MSRTTPHALAACLVVASAGCFELTRADEDRALVDRARAAYPTTLDVYAVMSQSCAPNAGVCHNTSNYPDLATPAAFAATVNEWCNLVVPDPTLGFDMCERRADTLVSGTFRAEIAFVDRADADTWDLTLRAPAVRTVAIAAVRFDDADGNVVFDPLPEWGVTLSMTEGDPKVRLSVAVDEPFFTEPFIESALLSLVPGDANKNGVFGADDAAPQASGGGHARLLVPGSLERSYVWGRITGTVPGSRMPLANDPLPEEAYVALACFIQMMPQAGMPALDAAVDYDACAYAASPERHAIDLAGDPVNRR